MRLTCSCLSRCVYLLPLSFVSTAAGPRGGPAAFLGMPALKVAAHSERRAQQLFAHRDCRSLVCDGACGALQQRRQPAAAPRRRHHPTPEPRSDEAAARTFPAAGPDNSHLPALHVTAAGSDSAAPRARRRRRPPASPPERHERMHRDRWRRRCRPSPLLLLQPSSAAAESCHQHFSSMSRTHEHALQVGGIDKLSSAVHACVQMHGRACKCVRQDPVLGSCVSINTRACVFRPAE